MNKWIGSRYESVVELKRTRARQSWKCHSCDRVINSGDYYFRQSLGLIRKPPGVRLNAFCLGCAHSPLAKKLVKGRDDMGDGQTTGTTSRADPSLKTGGYGNEIVKPQRPPVSSGALVAADKTTDGNRKLRPVMEMSLFEWALGIEQNCDS